MQTHQERNLSEELPRLGRPVGLSVKNFVNSVNWSRKNHLNVDCIILQAGFKNTQNEGSKMSMHASALDCACDVTKHFKFLPIRLLQDDGL